MVAKQGGRDPFPPNPPLGSTPVATLAVHLPGRLESPVQFPAMPETTCSFSITANLHITQHSLVNRMPPSKQLFMGKQDV